MGYFRDFHSISGFHLYAYEVSSMSKFLKQSKQGVYPLVQWNQPTTTDEIGYSYEKGWDSMVDWLEGLLAFIGAGLMILFAALLNALPLILGALVIYWLLFQIDDQWVY